jgi:hypothetical protein
VRCAWRKAELSQPASPTTSSPPGEKATARQDQAGKPGTGDGTGDREWVPANRFHHREFGRTGRVGLKLARAVEGVLNKLTGSSEVAEVASRILIEADDGGCPSTDKYDFSVIDVEKLGVPGAE